MPYTLLATGDLMLQRPIVRPDAPGMAEVWRAFAAADHVFANLEVVLTRRGEASDKLVCLRADPELADELAAAHVGIVSAANNHALDYGLGGLTDTLAATRSAGVVPVGAGSRLDEALRPALIQAGALTVGFLGLASTLPNGCGAAAERGGVAPVRVLSRFVVDPVTIDEDPGMAPYVETVTLPGDQERAAQAVSEAKRQADLVVVGVHWGVPHGWVAEFQGELAGYQQPLAHALVDAGADAVVGHHPHVLHGIEVYRGRPIFYSLGNFLFHSLLAGSPAVERRYPPYSWETLRGELNHYGGVARVSWKDPAAGPARMGLVPVWLDEAGEPAWADGMRAEVALDRVEDLSRKFGTSFRRDGGGLEVLMG